jgi:uncharacterized DUF497 family protein
VSAGLQGVKNLSRVGGAKLALGFFVHTLGTVQVSFDPVKNARNISERNLSFESVSRFKFESALIDVDDRREYGEKRYVAIGLLDSRVHVVCFTETAEGVRVISFRKANAREVRYYEKAQTTP